MVLISAKMQCWHGCWIMICWQAGSEKINLCNARFFGWCGCECSDHLIVTSEANYGKLCIIHFTDCFGRPAERILNFQACVFFPVVSTRLDMILFPTKLALDFMKNILQKCSAWGSFERGMHASLYVCWKAN